MIEVRLLPMAKFATGTTIKGIEVNTLMVAFAFAAPLLLLLQNTVSILPLIIGTAVALWYVFIPLAEWITEVIPPRYFAHLLDWLVQGGCMYVTNDSNPLPLVVQSSTEKRLQEEELMDRAARLQY